MIKHCFNFYKNKMSKEKSKLLVGKKEKTIRNHTDPQQDKSNSPEN